MFRRRIRTLPEAGDGHSAAGRARSSSTVLTRTIAGLSAATVIGACVTLVGTGSAGAAAAANLVTNSGFENGLSGWSCTDGSGAAVSSPAHSGSSALKATPSGLGNAQCSQTVSVQPNSKYTLSAFVQGSYVYLGASGTGATSEPQTWTPNSASYSELSTSFTTGANTTSVTVYLHGWYGTPAYLADDVSLTGPGGTTPPPTTPPPTDPPTTPPPTDPPTTPPPTDPPGDATCATKPKPTGKVLQGYWENWDGASNGVHPGMGWVPITDSRIAQHGYNVINAAFPVILSDGTVLWEDGMDAGVKVSTPAEMCEAKANGATLLMSIGGAAAGIDLSSSKVADRFVETVVPILKKYNFDGIDIDIETGLSGSGNISTLSASQSNLIRIIDGVLAKMPAGFGLTMAPETAYVTGGSVTYGSIWGAYLPIIKKYVDNGRLWWLNMQYYNGSMYGCSGDSYQAGTVEGFTAQTTCLNNGLTIQGTTIKVPYDKQVPGLPAQPGAGGGYMTTGQVGQAWNAFNGSLKGLMTWSLNWDGSKGWSFGNNVKSLQNR
ncbi:MULTISPECIES: carbohydrate binding domain-containing protein [unclassified Streptomyces]|uniref:carbohydrate binding domain-containing protein n=1 Tax=unclassified Streptomyces TaxID=2593676 RepID=UPI002ED5B6E3|nr:glycosyl hydrolase family 18 protein [Streptomyces sp. NBC_00891]WSY08272.1 glycosyl hydrolase family 18 protein [Streptomyces sp. NBC_00890]WSZ09895.1 glycosyl hydrolase family 18 protein [Streptomyces sp. NBC_00869]WSZ22603.1 glycosyl hydrolase family 18 protein [Streptomyces sp. NBC_00870]